MEKNYSHQQLQRTETDLSIISGKEIKLKEVKEPKYSISLNQFASFIDGTEVRKNRIVKDELKEDRSYFAWYGAVSPCIKRSILTGDTKVIYNKINEFKKRKEEGKFHTPNKVGTVLALENYLKMALPLKFRVLNKEEINPEVKYFDYMGIRLNVAPDLIFKAEKGGNKIIGAVKVIKKKSTKVSNLYLRTISYFLRNYLEKNVAQDEETVDLDCCLVIDVFGKKVLIAENNSSSPNRIILEGAKEFSNIWDQIE